MRILVTGNLGFIGSLLTQHLINLGHSVIGVDNYLYKQYDIAANFKKKYKLTEYMQYNLDVTYNFTEIGNILKTCDVVIPLAGLVGEPICRKYPEKAQETNLSAIKYLLSRMSDQQIILYPDTNSGLGNSPSGFADELSPMNPVSNYGRDKYEAELAVLEHPNSVCFRLATVAGVTPRTRLDVLVNTIAYEAFFSDGEKVKLYNGDFYRNYVNVRDVVRGFGFAIENISALKQNVFNFGLDEANCSKRDLCKLVQKFIPFETEEMDLPDPDKRNYKVSSQKIKNAGFKFIFSIEDAVQDLVSYFKLLPTNREERQELVKYNVATSV